MGDYTGVKTELKIKKGAPEVLRGHFKSIVVSDNLELFEWSERVRKLATLTSFTPDSDDIDTALVSCLCGTSAYFATWDEEHTPALWDETPEYLHFKTYRSTKYPKIEIWKSILEKMQPYLYLEEGDILVRMVSEFSGAEQVVYFSEGEIRLLREGHYYEQHGNHPRHDKIHHVEVADERFLITNITKYLETMVDYMSYRTNQSSDWL